MSDFKWDDQMAKDFAAFVILQSGLLDTEDALAKFKKSKEPKPKFITEDGVDIYDKDVYIYEVDTSNWRVIKSQFIHYNHFFSTNEAAENFILMNKPCLSVNDVVDIIKSECDGTYNSIDRWEFILGIHSPAAIQAKLRSAAKTKIK